MITHHKFFFEELGQTILLAFQSSSKYGISNSHFAFQAEIHFWNFWFFVVKNFIIRVLWIKVPRHKPERNVVEKLWLFMIVSLKEMLENMEDIFKQITSHQSSLHWFGQLIQRVIMLIDWGESIILPKVCKMRFNLIIQALREWFVSCESSEQGHPVS